MRLGWVKPPPGRPGVVTADGVKRVQGGAGLCRGGGGRGEAGGAGFQSC